MQYSIGLSCLFTDNDSVKNLINNSSSKCKNCMVLLRLITMEGLLKNVRIFAKHVGTKDNGKPDALSRLDFTRFRDLAKGTMNQEPTPMPEQIWSISKNLALLIVGHNHSKTYSCKTNSTGSSKRSTKEIQLIINKLRITKTEIQQIKHI